MLKFKRIAEIAAVLSIVVLLSCTNTFAAVSFVSATNNLTLSETVDDNGNTVFVFGGIAEGESSALTFSTDTDCPGVAMAGGAEFSMPWSCAAGVISATVINRGGMFFGPGPEGSPTTFYVTFSDAPAPPGSDTAPEALSGIQISIFGDINSWDLDGETTEAGVSFGVELTGAQGGDAHFRMYLPQPAVAFLGGVLGVLIGGKPDPFATVTTNEDGSVDISVDIAALKSASLSSSRLNSLAKTVTKKITAGERSLGIAFAKSSVKRGRSVAMAMCAGTEFEAGDVIPVKFTVGGKAAGVKRSFTLDSSGCARTSVKLNSSALGSLTAKISYKGDKAKTTIKVNK